MDDTELTTALADVPEEQLLALLNQALAKKRGGRQAGLDEARRRFGTDITPSSPVENTPGGRGGQGLAEARKRFGGTS